MRFSIVIPTYKRPEILQRCLEALFAQKFPKDNFEIIVVDDNGAEEHGDPNTEKVIRSFETVRSGFALRYLWQAHQGQGIARNLGAQHAKGEIILFMGDDIFADQDLLKHHDESHLSNPRENEAVLGHIDWHPELTVTPLMQFMVTGGAIFGKFGGHQFAYDLLRNKDEADYRFFYTSNISLKKSLLRKNPFDPWFSGYGWEDIELGYRLFKKSSLRLFYNPDAIGYHYHPMTEADFVSRMRQIGESSVKFHEKYPELQKNPSIKKRLALKALSSPLSLMLLRRMHPFWYYYALSKKYYLEGIAKNVK